MSEILTFAKRAQSFNGIKLLKQVLNSKESKDFLIDLNTRKQLFDKGINSEGVKLDSIGGGYSAATIEGTANFEGKISKGLPIDRITLFDTGEFYDSFTVEFNLPNVTIFANDNKDGTLLTSEWGNDIIGLTDENKRIFEEYIVDKVFDLVLSGLLS